MIRGMFNAVSAPRPPAGPSTPLHVLDFARKSLAVVLIAAALAFPPANVHAAGEVTQHEVFTRSDLQAARSCRGVYHVVRRGETIYSIARRYGSSAYRIAACNGLGSYTVYVGDTLLVPLG